MRIIRQRVIVQQTTAHQEIHQVIMRQGQLLMGQEPLTRNLKGRLSVSMKAWTQGNPPKFYQN